MTVAVIVAHPDDEALWCGGRMLSLPKQDWLIITLCRASDAERAKRFETACREFGAAGVMADLDDGAAQAPLEAKQVEKTLLSLLPRRELAAIYTHGPRGEYTRHRRHEECSRAVTTLCVNNELVARRVNLFAYEDDAGKRLPRAAHDADELDVLSAAILERKLHIITDIYGFPESSWEARAAPAVEAFYVHSDISRLARFMDARRPTP